MLTVVNTARTPDARALAFDVRVRAGGPSEATVAVYGEFDWAGTEAFGAAVVEQVRAGRTQVAVDLGETSFLDCAALGAIVDAEHTVRAAGGRLTLRRVKPRVRRLLRVTRLDEVLRLAPAEDGDAAEDIQ